MTQTETATPADFQRGGTHAPLILLNPGGIRTCIGCTCGQRPKTPPQRMSTNANAYFSHARKLGVRVPHVGHAVFGPGMAASGMTWDEWYDAVGRANPDASPLEEV